MIIQTTIYLSIYLSIQSSVSWCGYKNTAADHSKILLISHLQIQPIHLQGKPSGLGIIYPSDPLYAQKYGPRRLKYWHPRYQGSLPSGLILGLFEDEILKTFLQYLETSNVHDLSNMVKSGHVTTSANALCVLGCKPILHVSFLTLPEREMSFLFREILFPEQLK